MTSVVDITDSAGGGSGYNNFDHRVIVWPVYLDKKKTVAEGRKIPIEWCVEYPQMGELRDVLDHLGFEHAYEESKCYPRDLTQYGRFRVLLKDPMTGAPKVEGITTRRQLLKAMGAYCTEFRVDEERFRAVADTGSPFLLVLAKGNCAGGPERWGCFEDLRFGGLDDESVEGFGGQNMDVVWRRGSVRLSTIDSNRRYASPWMLQAALADRRNGARSGAWTVPREGTDLLFEPINFGVVKSVERTGGSSALYLGLARDRNPRANVRPTFLEQTDVEALAFDFPQRTLTLARRPLIKGDGIPLLDLRPLGAPVAQYAAAVHRLLVNGQEIKISRPCVAIIDTGTSGLVVSDTLYDSDELPMPGAAMRTVEVELLSERGEVQTLQAARRPAPLESQAVDAPPVVDRFPLIVTPVHLNWFDEPRRRSLGPLGLPPAEAAAASDQISPHVLFVGLAFLSERKLTIDIGQMRLRFDA